MADILFAGNDLATLSPLNSNATMRLGEYQAAEAGYAPGDIRISNESKAVAHFAEPIQLGETVWVHCRMRPEDITGSPVHREPVWNGDPAAPWGRHVSPVRGSRLVSGGRTC